MMELPVNARSRVNMHMRRRVIEAMTGDIHTKDPTSPLGLTFGQEMQDRLERELDERHE